MRSLWAAGLLLRRLRNERGIVLLIALLVGSTSFVFAAAPRLFNRVSDSALRSIAQDARPADRNLALALSSSLTPSNDGGVASVRAHGDKLAEQIPPSVAAIFTERTLRVTTARFYVPDPPLVETHITLRYQDGVQDATRLVDGRWPVSHGAPLNSLAPGVAGNGGANAPPVVIEAALSTAEATAAGVRVGDHLTLTLDGSDPLLNTQLSRSDVFGFRGGYRIAPAELEIVGLFEPIDPQAEYWYGDSGLLQVEQHGTEDNPIIFATAYMAPEQYPDIWKSGLPFHYEWRFLVDPQRLDAGQVDTLRADLHRLGLISGTGTGVAGTVTVLTGLPAIFDKYAGERALSESVLSIAALGPFGLAAGAMAMVAILLVRRRRATLALARGRGATGALVLGTQLWESTLIAGGAALLGLLLAVVLIPARDDPLSGLLAIAVAAVAVVLLVVASWPTARQSLGQLDRDDAPVLRVPPRRLVIEATVVGVAVAATLLLRQRGLSIGPAGSVANVDPLLASVPVLSGFAAGIAAVRVYPLPIRALGWLAARRRDIVPVLGLRTIERQPASANLPILVLLLTAAFGAFASVVASSLDHGQVVASYLNVGADYRIEKIEIGGLATVLDPMKVTGVQVVAPGIVDPLAGFTGAPNQRASIHLEAIDPTTYDQVTAGTAATPAWPDAFLADPAGDGLGTPDNPIPAILSTHLPIGSADLQPGDTFRILVEGKSLTFRLAERRDAFPGITDAASFAVVPFDWIQAAFGTRLVSPSVLWLRAPAGLSGPLASEITGVGEAARVVSRYDAYDALHDAPFGAVIVAGYGAALVTAAIYMAMTIIGAVILSGARRTRDLAFLRTLGVTDVQRLALTVMEHAPPVILAIIPGVALGIGIAILCAPGLGLDTFVGATGVPLYVDVPALAAIVAALIGVVAVAVAAGTWISSRARMADALRIGDD